MAWESRNVIASLALIRCRVWVSMQFAVLRPMKDGEDNLDNPDNPGLAQ